MVGWARSAVKISLQAIDLVYEVSEWGQERDSDRQSGRQTDREEKKQDRESGLGWQQLMATVLTHLTVVMMSSAGTELLKSRLVECQIDNKVIALLPLPGELAWCFS